MVEPVQSKAELLAGNLAVDASLHTISSDGRWRLAEAQQHAVIVDFTSGNAQSHSLPADSVRAPAGATAHDHMEGVLG